MAETERNESEAPQAALPVERPNVSGVAVNDVQQAHAGDVHAGDVHPGDVHAGDVNDVAGDVHAGDVNDSGARESSTREQSDEGAAPDSHAVAPVTAGESSDDAAAAAADGDGGEDGGDEESSAGDASAPGDPATKAKRKRRRRRKRKDGSTATGAAGEGAVGGDAQEAHAPRPADSKKKESHAPFAHLFSGAQGSGKRHAFAVGEVVAGRVQRVDYGVIVVDLFGKATAIADEYEPREVPPLPEPPAPESGVETASASPDGQDDGQVAALHNTDTATTVAGDVAAHDTSEASDASDTRETSETVDPLGETAPDLPVSADSAQAAVDDSASQATEALAESFNLGSSGQPAPAELTPSAVHDAHDAHAPSPVTDGGEAAHVASASTTSSGEHFAPSDDDLDDDHDHDDGEVSAIEPSREKPEPPKLGQVFKGRVGAVSESGHVAILNRIIDGRAVREQLEARRQEHKRVHGVVYGFNRGGFDVLVEGLRAFCPASAMALEDIGDPLDFVGRKLEFLLPASRAGSKDLIVSRRSILERLQRRQTKEFLRSLTPGMKFKGRVSAVRDFGLFVDIGGVEGLVHQSELSFAFGTKPNSVAKVGDEIDVQVLRVGGDARRDSGKKERLTRVSLSVKALLPDPWDAHADALREGNVHKGKVVRATEFGAFIEIVPEIEGLLHITELGRDLKHASQAVREGDDVYVAIDRVDRRARRISLSKLSPAEVQAFESGSLTQDDAVARNLRQGNNVKLKVERIEPRCVFARVAGTIGKRGRAFIPSSETGTDRGTDLRKRFPIGSELEAKIIGIDRDGSLKCSVKAMQVDEERQAVKNYRREAAKQGFGTFGDLLRAKLGEAQK